MKLHFLQGYLSQFGVLAWMLLFGGMALAFWRLKRWPMRALACALVVGLFAAYPGRWAWIAQKNVERYETSHAMFLERCRTQAGYKINRVVKDVDGILLPKVRHRMNEYDPTAPGAAFAMEDVDDGYLASFLYYRDPPPELANSYRVSPNKNPGASPGFSYVDIIDEKDGQRYRHAIRWPDSWEDTWEQSRVHVRMGPRVFFGKVPESEPMPRYAVTFEDAVVPEERANGIASSTVKVIDIQANEVLAEMRRYAYYPGKIGSFAGANWLRADKCPGVLFGSGQATRQFVDRVLVARGATLPPPLK